MLRGSLVEPSEITSKSGVGGGADTSGGTGGDNGTVQASLSDNVDLDGRVATRIVDGTRVDFGDGHGDESGK